MNWIETALKEYGDYGYALILFITFIEGETIVILAGIAAKLEYLNINWVIVCAIVGSFSGDQLWFYMGRRWGPQIIAKRPSWQASAKKVYGILDRHKYWLMLTFRFYYGLRNVTPFVIGSAGISRLLFFTLNLIGAIIWAFAFAYAGYYIGKGFVTLLGKYHLWFLGGLVLVAFSIWLVLLLRRRRKARAQGFPPKKIE